jgi:hypothetical protein
LSYLVAASFWTHIIAWTGPVRAQIASKTVTKNATKPELRLQWMAPAGCPNEAEMLTRVERALGDNNRRAQLSATVDVTQRTSGYRAVLRIQDQQRVGERTIEHAQCDVLAESVTLVIALSASDRDLADGNASGTPIVFAVSAHASTVLGPLPKPAFGVGVSAALEGALSLRWELSGSYYAVQAASYHQMNVGANFQMVRLAARSCRIWSVGRLDLAPCLGAAVYRLDGQGFGGKLQTSGAAYVWGPELSLLVRLRFARYFALQLSGAAALALARQHFTYIDLGSLHQPAALAYQVLLAPEVLF